MIGFFEKKYVIKVIVITFLFVGSWFLWVQTSLAKTNYAKYYCTKTIANCTGADKMQVPIADTDVDPSKINYGCPSDMPTYLGCAGDKIPCCGPYVSDFSSASKACQTAIPNLYSSSCTTQQECEAQITAWKSAIGPGSTVEWSDNFLPDAACPSPTPGEVGCCMLIGKEVAPTSSGTTTPKPPTEYKLANPLGTTSIPVIIGRIIRTFLGIVGAIALAVFVYGGVMWMISRGDQGQVKKGQDALKNAVIGLFIVMFSYALTGNFIKFWTAEERDIASQEGRLMEEDPTQADTDLATIRSVAESAQAEVEAGQVEAVEAGVEAGVAPTPASKCNAPGMTEAEKQDCLEGIGTGWLDQSKYNTDKSSGFVQPDCKPGDEKCSSVGWKTVCNGTMFDAGYGAYTDLQCLPYDECKDDSIVSSDCSALKEKLKSALGTEPSAFKCESFMGISNFGLHCGSGDACCKKK